MPLCTICTALNPLAGVLDDEEKDAPERERLGLYEELSARADAGCEGCAFFRNIITESTEWKHQLDALPDHVVFLDSLRLDLRPKAKEDGFTYCLDDLKFDICSAGGVVDPDPNIDQLRPVHKDPRDERCFELMRSWVEGCAGHEMCPKRSQVVLPKRVVEISPELDVAPKICITDGKLGEYAVLSHCWGDCKTTKQEVWGIVNSPNGFRIEQIPKNFGDAITIARRLGFRYLWVDALCVAPEEWASMSSDALSIYGQAAVMIAANASENCDAGIFQDRIVHFSPGFGLNKDRFLRQHLLRWDEDIEWSPLERRGWSAQERMLAPRIIHFTKRQLMWECASAGPKCLYFEASGIPDDTGSGEIDSRFWKSCFQPLVSQALQTRYIQAVSESPIDAGSAAQNTINRIKRWHQCTDKFSRCQLTDPLDKLPAVANLAAVVDDGTLGEYLAGIWSKHFAAGISWGRQYRLLRRATTYRAPSWSWASLDGKISSAILHEATTGIDELDQDEEWKERYGLKLLEAHMVPRDKQNPYMGVLEGSHVVVEGACLDLKQYGELISNETGAISGIIGLDSSNTFDCPHCAPKPLDDDAGQNATPDHTDHQPFNLVMISKGGGWTTMDSKVYVLLLKWTNKEQSELERVGFGLLQKGFFNWKRLEDLRKAFDAAGWERKVMKLV